MANLKRRGFLGGMGALFATTPEKILKASGVKVSPLGDTWEAIRTLTSKEAE